VKGVEVLSILAKVKNAKRVIFYPNCINGLKREGIYGINLLIFVFI
jgi:hypothetical protein